MQPEQTEDLLLKDYKDKLLANLQKMKNEYSFDLKSLFTIENPDDPINKLIEKSKYFMNSSMNKFNRLYNTDHHDPTFEIKDAFREK